MSDLENLVRDSLQARVRHAPVILEPADRAIARAGAQRRRGAVITVGSLAVMLALTVGGFALLNESASLSASPAATGSPTPTAVTAPPATATARPDLLIDPATDGRGWQAMLTASGRTISFSGIGVPVDTAYRVPSGWLLGNQLAGIVYLMRDDGTASALLTGVDAYAVAPDGQRIAWRADNRLHVGHLDGTTLVEDRSTPAPPRGDPIAFTGTAVVLGYSETGGGIDHHDVWIPANGDYSASWNANPLLVAVYQPAPDGSLLGVVRPSASSKEACLARLDPSASLRETRQACGLPITIDPAGLVSPDGRWLATTALSPDEQPETALIDLNYVFDHPRVAGTWAAAGPLAWLDPSTVVLTSVDARLLLAHIGQPDLTAIFAPGDPVGRKLIAVRRLGDVS
jgi:hypothetical protein